MRPWMVRLSLLALVIGFTHPAWAESLSGFTFPHVTYSHTVTEAGGFTFNRFEGQGAHGKYLGMGNVIVDLRFMPDPEGAHPISWHIFFQGGILQLGIPFHYDPQGSCWIMCGHLLEGDPFSDGPDITELGGRRYLVSFEVASEEVNPLLGLPDDGIGGTWDALVIGPASAEDVLTTNWAMVPMTPTGLLFGLGVVILVAMRVRRLI